MSTSWHDHRSHWQAFAAWERERLRSRTTDFSQALDWMAEAWELARRFDPSWATEQTVEAHCRHLAEIQKAFARVRLTP